MDPVWIVALILLVAGGIPALLLAWRARREVHHASRAVRELTAGLGTGARSLGSELGRLEERAETTRGHARTVLDATRSRNRPLRRHR